PTTTRPNPAGGFLRDAFPGNVIPAARFNVVSKNLLNLWPQPNRPGTGPAGVNNFVYQSPSRGWNNQYTGRLDHQFSAAHRLFGRFTKRWSGGEAKGDYQTLGDPNLGNGTAKNYSLTLNDT